MIPFLLGLLGMFFHYRNRPRDFAAIMAMFIITGIGIIVYSNQPPNEPRERDYVYWRVRFSPFVSGSA
jgi:drug/metabolite transporter (DMT)-like permease